MDHLLRNREGPEAPLTHRVVVCKGEVPSTIVLIIERHRLIFSIERLDSMSYQIKEMKIWKGFQSVFRSRSTEAASVVAAASAESAPSSS